MYIHRRVEIHSFIDLAIVAFSGPSSRLLGFSVGGDWHVRRSTMD